MGASFAAAATQTLDTVPSFTTFTAFSCGFWAYPRDIAINGGCVSIGSSASSEYVVVMHLAADWLFETDGSGASVDTQIVGSAVANRWQYVVCRGISATNHRLSVLTAAGDHLNAQQTTDRGTITTVNTLHLGRFGCAGANTHFLNGVLAEVWWTLADIEPGGAVLGTDTLRQLAYYGPFSIPGVAKAIYENGEYRALRTHPNRNVPGEFTQFRGRERSWTSVGALTGPHPPLAPTYVRPTNQTKNIILV